MQAGWLLPFMYPAVLLMESYDSEEKISLEYFSVCVCSKGITLNKYINERKEHPPPPPPSPFFFYLQKFDVAVPYIQELLNGRTKALRCVKFTSVFWPFNAFFMFVQLSTKVVVHTTTAAQEECWELWGLLYCFVVDFKAICACVFKKKHFEPFLDWCFVYIYFWMFLLETGFVPFYCFICDINVDLYALENPSNVVELLIFIIDLFCPFWGRFFGVLYLYQYNFWIFPRGNVRRASWDSCFVLTAEWLFIYKVKLNFKKDLINFVQ